MTASESGKGAARLEKRPSPRRKASTESIQKDALKMAQQGLEIKAVEQQTARDNLVQAQAAKAQRIAERGQTQPLADEPIVQPLPPQS